MERPSLPNEDVWDTEEVLAAAFLVFDLIALNPGQAHHDYLKHLNLRDEHGEADFNASVYAHELYKHLNRSFSKRRLTGYGEADFSWPDFHQELAAYLKLLGEKAPDTLVDLLTAVRKVAQVPEVARV